MSPMNALSPDQRAVIQLVLQQERSYEDLAGMLGIPVDSVRDRAVAGLETLAGDGGISADHRAFITDFLLGQLPVSERERARRFLATTPDARDWALDVADELDELGPDLLPDIPLGGQDPVPAAAEPEIRSEPRTETAAEPVAPRPRPRPREDRGEPRGSADRPRASRLGGALILAGVSIVVAVLLIKVLGGGDDSTRAGNDGTPTPTQTATAQEPQQLFAIPLEGVGDVKAEGTMAVYQQDQQVFFALEATKVPKENEGEAYAIWMIGGKGKPRRLGYFQEPVKNGRLGTIGPESKDIPKFPEWLTTYERIVISRETAADAKQPGPIILSGTLPAGAS